MRRTLGVASALVIVLAASTIVPAQDRETDVKAATSVVMRQLEAFRRGDFDTAYTFASATIHDKFDRAGFETMVKGGYPEIARSAFAFVAQSRVSPDGTIYLNVKIRGANGNSVEALYELVRENEEWKINGVAARPDPSLL